MLINDYNHPDHACFMGFWPGSQTVGLANDDGSGINYPWMMTGVLGSTTPLQNSQCQVDLAHSSVVLSGNNVTVNVALTFLPAFAGARQIWLQAGDNAGLTAQWQQMGTWTVPLPPPDFTVTARTTSQTVTAGAMATYMYDVAALNGLDGTTIHVQTVSIPAPNCLSNWTQSSNWNAGTNTGTVTLNIFTTSACPSGTYGPVVTWLAGSISKTKTDTTLTIGAAPQVTVTVTPS
jgi:hypothetical protein